MGGGAKLPQSNLEAESYEGPKFGMRVGIHQKLEEELVLS